MHEILKVSSSSHQLFHLTVYPMCFQPFQTSFVKFMSTNLKTTSFWIYPDQTIVSPCPKILQYLLFILSRPPFLHLSDNGCIYDYKGVMILLHLSEHCEWSKWRFHDQVPRIYHRSNHRETLIFPLKLKNEMTWAWSYQHPRCIPCEASLPSAVKDDSRGKDGKTTDQHDFDQVPCTRWSL